MFTFFDFMGSPIIVITILLIFIYTFRFTLFKGIFYWVLTIKYHSKNILVCNAHENPNYLFYESTICYLIAYDDGILIKAPYGRGQDYLPYDRIQMVTLFYHVSPALTTMPKKIQVLMSIQINATSIDQMPIHFYAGLLTEYVKFNNISLSHSNIFETIHAHFPVVKITDETHVELVKN